MEIKGKIIAVLSIQKGVSQRTGNEWESQDYILQTEGEYPKTVKFNVFGSERIKNMGIKDGETLTVFFDIDAHEYNGRWFNEVRAWKVEREDTLKPEENAPQEQEQKKEEKQVMSQEEIDKVCRQLNQPAESSDLPF